MSDQTILEIKNMSFSYMKRKVLDTINFSVKDRDFCAIIGPNGGGKTTLVKLIVGLLKPDTGSISLFGKKPRSNRKHVGYLSQYSEVDLNYPIGVLDIVLMSTLSKRIINFPTKKEKEKALSCLKQVGIEHLFDRHLSELSGGERQRVFLARVLMNEPKLLILDEPTSSVDFKGELNIYNLLKKLNESMAILIISHDITAVSSMIQKIACLNKTLVTHESSEITEEMLHDTYTCDIDLIAHGVPHRVLKKHDH